MRILRCLAVGALAAGSVAWFQVAGLKPAAAAGPTFQVITLNACAVKCDGTVKINNEYPDTDRGVVPRDEILGALIADHTTPRVVAMQEFCITRAAEMDYFLSAWGFHLHYYIASHRGGTEDCDGFGNFLWVKNTATSNPPYWEQELESRPSGPWYNWTICQSCEYKGAIYSDAWVLTERFATSSAHTRSGSAANGQASSLCNVVEFLFGDRPRSLVGDLNTEILPTQCSNNNMRNLATNAQGSHLITLPPSNKFDWIIMSNDIGKNQAVTYDSESDHHSVVAWLHFK